MSKGKGTKVALRFAGLLLCILLMQTAYAEGNQNQFTVNFTNTGNMNDSLITISPIITQTEVEGGNQNQFTATPINTGNMNDSSITISPTITQTEVVTGNATNEKPMTEDSLPENPTPEDVTNERPIIGTVVNNVSPSYYSTYLVAGSSTQLTVSFTNSGNETLVLNPKLVSTPNSINNINENWITISPTNVTVAPGSVQNFVVEINVPRDTESGNYQAAIAFTNDLVPDSIQYVNSMQLDVSVQAQPKIELQTSYISDNVEVGKEYEYQIKIKNVDSEDITIDPKVNNYNYYSGSTQAFSNDAIEISAPTTIEAGGVASMTIRVQVPENATGYYNGYIDMNVNGKTNDGYSPQISLGFSIWQQTSVPYVKTFNTTNNYPVTIEVSTSRYDSDMGLRVSPIKEKPSFELELTCNSIPVNMTLVKSVESGSPSIGSYYPTWVTGNEYIYQENYENYIETYMAPGSVGDWELAILPKNANNFAYSITKGDSNLAITGNVTTENTTTEDEATE